MGFSPLRTADLQALRSRANSVSAIWPEHHLHLVGAVTLHRHSEPSSTFGPPHAPLRNTRAPRGLQGFAVFMNRPAPSNTPGAVRWRGGTARLCLSTRARSPEPAMGFLVLDHAAICNETRYIIPGVDLELDG